MESVFLRDHKIKVTEGRKVILQILKDSDDAMSVDYIYDMCIRRGLPINLSTVYRTLELFFEKDIVNKFDMGNGKYNYTLKNDDHTHVIECEICHKEVEIDCPMIQIKEIIKNKTGFTLLDDDLKFKAICKDCKERKNHTKE